MKKVVPLIGAILVAACTYQNPVRVTPTFSANSAVQGPAAGRYVLVFDPSGARLSRTVRPSGISCALDVYPVNIRTETLELTRSTLEEIFGPVQFAQRPPTTAEMRRRRIDGTITFRVDKFGTRLDFSGRSATGVATTEFVLSATLVGADGRRFARSVRSVQRSNTRRRNSCRGAAEAVGRSIEIAMEGAFGLLGKEFARYRGTTRVASTTSGQEAGSSRRSPTVASTAPPRKRGFAPKTSTSPVEEVQAPPGEARTTSVGVRSVSEEDAKRIERDRRVARNRIVEQQELSDAPRRSGARTSAVASSAVEAPGATPSRASRGLEPHQVAWFRGQIQNCFTDEGLREASALSVVMRVRLDPDGSLFALPEIEDKERLNTDPIFRATAINARNALIDCAPLKTLPRASYEAWRDITLAFGPE